MTSAAFTINGAALDGGVVVTASSTVTLALTDLTGARLVNWAIQSASESSVALPTITQSGNIGQTATFTFPAAPAHGLGLSLLVSCTVIDGTGAQVSQRGICGIASPAGTLLACYGEKAERRANGWTEEVNQAIAATSPEARVGAVAPLVPSTLVTTFQSGHGWTNAYGGAGSTDLNNADDPYIGTQSVKLVTDGAGTVRGIKRWAMTPIDFTGKCLRLAVKVSGVANLATDGFYVYLGSSSLANYRVFVVLPQSGQNWFVDGEWTELTIPFNVSASRSSTSGSFARNNVTDITIRVKDDASGTPVTVYVGKVAVVTEPTAKISICCDDGYASVFSVAAPLLANYAMPATHYTICELVGQAGRITVDQLKRLQRVGWDVALHAYAAQVHTDTYPGTDAAALRQDLDRGIRWLKANGFNGYTHGSYPLGKFTGGHEQTLQIVREKFAAYRSIYTQVGGMVPVDDPHRMRLTINLAYPLTLASAKALLDAAMTANEWCIILFHNLVTTPTTSTEWATADFDALLAYIRSTYPAVPVETIGRTLGVV